MLEFKVVLSFRKQMDDRFFHVTFTLISFAERQDFSNKM